MRARLYRFYTLLMLAATPLLDGCTATQPPHAPQIQVPVAQIPALPPAPDPSQIAEQIYDRAVSACKGRFPFVVGGLVSRFTCIDDAEVQYLFPVWDDGQKAIRERFTKYTLQAASLVDDHSMSIQEYNVYATLSQEILSREVDAVAREDERLNPDTSGQSELNYDTEQANQPAIEADEHNIAISNLNNQQQDISDDRDEYEYCFGLHSKNLDACAPQKFAFQSDLAIYQAMAASVPQVEQQEGPSPAQTLQQQDIQDDMDAIAGGIVP